MEAQWVAERRSLKRFRTEQSPYSLLARGIETSVLPTCQQYGIGVLTWSPLAGGFLSGAYRKGQPIDLTTGRPALQPHWFDPSIPENARKLEIVERLIALATDSGCSLRELALAFPITHPAVTSVIIGPRTMHQLEQLLAGSSLALDDHTLDRIDEIVPPGTNHHTVAWRPPELDDPNLRRRPPAGRRATQTEPRITASAR